MFLPIRTCTRMHLVAGYEWLRPKVKLEGLCLWILRAPIHGSAQIASSIVHRDTPVSSIIHLEISPARSRSTCLIFSNEHSGRVAASHQWCSLSDSCPVRSKLTRGLPCVDGCFHCDILYFPSHWSSRVESFQPVG